MKPSTLPGNAGKRKTFQVFFLIGIAIFLFVTTTSATWVQCPGFTSTETCLAFYVKGNDMIVSTNRALFRSINNGSTWTPFQPAPDSLRPRILSFVWNKQKLYAGTNNQGVCVSNDNGTSWTPINGSNGRSIKNMIIVSLIASGDTLIAGTMNNGVFRSTDNGSSWNQISSGLGATATVWSLAVSKGAVYAATQGHGVYRSSDYGKTWTQITNGLTTTLTGYAFMEKGDTLFLGANGIYYTPDGGKTWRPVKTGLPDNCDVESFTISRELVFAATNKGVFLSQDRGTTWRSINDSLSNTTIMSIAVSGDNVFLGTSSRGLLKRSLSEMVNVVKLEVKQTYTCPTNYYNFKVTGTTAYDLYVNGILLPQKYSYSALTQEIIQIIEQKTGKEVNYGDVITFFAISRSNNGVINVVSNFATIPFDLYISSNPSPHTAKNDDMRISNSFILCSTKKENVQISLYRLTGEKVWTKQIAGEKAIIPDYLSRSAYPVMIKGRQQRINSIIVK